MKIKVACASILLALVIASRAEGEVVRFALVVGNNTGAQNEANLRFAENDASRLGDVLLELGGFLPENVLLLRGQDASALRRTLIAFNDRIRARTQDPSVQPLLLVFFSGHADARALHLGGTELELVEIEQLVRGSAATYRILIVDACRSGALTQVKGGTSAPPFPIRLEERLDGEGVVFLTSSASNEDAQESEELKGSFFTHYFISGLLGAADSNEDGRVGLREAYGYAYEQTLKASSRSLAGLQHPTFRYELKGRDDLILTEPVVDKRRGMVELPEGRTYLIMQSAKDGPVVAEVESGDRARRISLKAGRYFVRSRARDHLLEGSVDVEEGRRERIDEAKLERIEYARLVRKGGTEVAFVHGPQAGYRLDAPISGGTSICQGGFIGYGFDSSAFSLMPRLGFCRSGFTNDSLAAKTDTIDLTMRLAIAIDFPLVTFDFGLGAGAAVFRQIFETLGRAPDRWIGAGELNAGAGAELDITDGAYMSADLALVAYVLRQETTDERGRIVELKAALAMRFAAAIGKRW